MTIVFPVWLITFESPMICGSVPSLNLQYTYSDMVYRKAELLESRGVMNGGMFVRKHNFSH